MLSVGTTITLDPDADALVRKLMDDEILRKLSVRK
jgi:hypothetical protein